MLVKVCKSCGHEKPLTSFPKRTKGQGATPKTQRQTKCRKCVKAKRSADSKCQLCGGEVTGRFCERCKEYNRSHSTACRARLRATVLAAYGGKCAYCGESRQLFLTIDHKNNDGAQHRRQWGGSTNRTYAWLKKNGFPTGFQVACFNCNCGKAIAGEDGLLDVLSKTNI